MVKVNTIGFKEFEAKIKKLPAEFKKEVGTEIQLAGERLIELAVKSLTSGMLKHPTGQLAGSITKIPVGQSTELSCQVVVQKEYAPYVEWGTITKVKVPSDLAAYALQFKGKGLRKNGGMSPRPFFFKHIPQVKKETVEHIKNILTDL